MLLLVSGSGVRTCCQIYALRQMLPATPWSVCDGNFILRCGVSRATTLLEAPSDEDGLREQKLVLHFDSKKFRRDHRSDQDKCNLI